MKKMKRLTATFVMFVMSLPFMLMAQEDSGTYIDNLNAQDSSYLQQDLGGAAEKSSSGNMTVIIILSVIVIAAIVFFVLRMKKKQ
jgi:hypothetical protein